MLYEVITVREAVGPEALAPGNLFSSPVEAVSLGLALMFGLLGLPHILMSYNFV